jgi:hypothetical protein
MSISHHAAMHPRSVIRIGYVLPSPLELPAQVGQTRVLRGTQRRWLVSRAQRLLAHGRQAVGATSAAITGQERRPIVLHLGDGARQRGQRRFALGREPRALKSRVRFYFFGCERPAAGWAIPGRVSRGSRITVAARAAARPHVLGFEVETPIVQRPAWRWMVRRRRSRQPILRRLTMRAHDFTVVRRADSIAIIERWGTNGIWRGWSCCRSRTSERRRHDPRRGEHEPGPTDHEDLPPTA